MNATALDVIRAIETMNLLTRIQDFVYMTQTYEEFYDPEQIEILAEEFADEVRFVQNKVRAMGLEKYIAEHEPTFMSWKGLKDAEEKVND